ncbi:MAG TPA: ATP-binding cassette domain-containing protein [Thermoleophilaceae bacterium]
MTLLALDRVTKRYWRGAHAVLALDEVSLELERGDFIAVWGRRGAGKSTLLRIAAGMESPDEGKVRFEGVDLSHHSRAKQAHLLRERIGVVQRSGPSIPSLPMLDYVALPLLGRLGRLEAHRRAAAALQRVGVKDSAGLTWGRLSDGAQALVAVAHAIVRGPSLVLADDPSTGLDAVEREHVVGLLRTAADETGIGVLLTTPDMPDMLRSNHVMSLSHGRLIQPRSEPGRVIDFPRMRPKSGG